MDEQRRYKIFYVSPDLLLSAFGFGGESYGIRAEGLPEGYRIEAVHFDDRAQAFAFRVFHESFPSVPPQGLIPTMEITIHQRVTPANSPEKRKGREFL